MGSSLTVDFAEEQTMPFLEPAHSRPSIPVSLLCPNREEHFGIKATFADNLFQIQA